jgi:hypothetical protein
LSDSLMRARVSLHTNPFILEGVSDRCSSKNRRVDFFRRSFSVACFLFLLLALPLSNYAQSPSITQFSPVTAAGAGFQLYIGGSGFGAAQGSGTITFNGVAASVQYWADTQIQTTVPTSATTGPVVVTVGGVASNGMTFTVTTTPLLISFSPSASGGIGSQVIIGGSSLGATQGSSTITFNGVSAGTSPYWTNTYAYATVPAGATTGPVVVTVGGVASNALTYTVNTTPQLSSFSPGPSGGVGSQVIIGGSNFGATQGSSTITFNGVSAGTSPYWSTEGVYATVPAGATTGPVVVTVGGVASNGLTFTVTTTPLLTGFSPGPSASVGSQVILGGSNFGAMQGTSTITFNGVSAGISPYWSDDGLYASVPAGATSGNVVVTVGGVASNPLSFTVIALPTITATVSPAANSSGWNDSNVTVTFTCEPGTGGLPIATCPSPQSVSTEGQNEVITGTVTDTGGNQASASATINLDKTIPALVVTAPADQSTVSSSTVSVTGTATDLLSGDSAVTCNGAAASLSGGSFSCNITAIVGVNLIMVRATDVAGNVAGSNFHVTLAGTLSAPASLSVTPTGVNMLVNGTQQFTAVDDQGRPRSDATWTLSDTTLATIDSAASPTVTAVAVGQVTLTANVGTVSAQTAINILTGTSLPMGTILWTSPNPSGSAPTQIVQAAPVTGGPALYSFGGGNITALTASGQQMWSVPVANAFSKYYFGQATLAGDSNGGVLVPLSQEYDEVTGIMDFDAQTGTKIWEYDAPSDQAAYGTFAVGLDGTVYLTVGNNGPESTAFGSVVALDSATGASRQIYAVPPSTISYNPAPCSPTIIVQPIYQGSSTFNISGASNVMVGPDGSVFFETTREDYAYTTACDGASGTFSDTRTLSLVQISPVGAANVTQLKQLVSLSSGLLSDLGPGLLIPDGQDGILTSWTLVNYATGQSVYHVTDVSSSGSNDYVIPVRPFEMVLGDTGSAFVTDQTNMVAFSITDGSTLWNYQAPSGSIVNIVASSSGGGLVGKTTDNNGVDTVVRLDASGNAAYDSWTGMQLDFALMGAWIGLPASSSPLTAFAAIAVDWADSIWSAPDQQGTQATTPMITVNVFKIVTANDPNNVESAQDSDAAITSDVSGAIKSWQKRGRILMNWNSGIQKTGPCPDGSSDCSFDDPLNLASPAFDDPQTGTTANEARRRFGAIKGVQLIFTRKVCVTGTSVGQICPPALTFARHAPDPSDPTHTKTIHMFENMTWFTSQADNPVDDDIVGHEIGHQFQLPHVKNVFDNLMCSGFICPSSPFFNLFPSQVHDAQAGAKLWQQ